MTPLGRPRWIVAHLLVILTIVGFVRLGLWQLDRHGERSDLRAAVAAGREMPPVGLAEAAEGSYRRVVAVGTYDGSLQMLVLRSYQGVSGYHVLTPLVTDGAAVLVDRGWIPLDAAVPDPPPGTVEATGQLWPAEEGSSVPDEQPEVVRRIDPEIQQAFASYQLRGDYLILAQSPQPESSPVPVPPPSVGLGPHLGYAGQWFLFALVVAIGYPLLLRRVLRTVDDRSGTA